MRVRIYNPLRKLLGTFPNEMEYDEQFRDSKNIVSEDYVNYGKLIENEYHGIECDTVLEVTVWDKDSVEELK